MGGEIWTRIAACMTRTCDCVRAAADLSQTRVKLHVAKEPKEHEDHSYGDEGGEEEEAKI